MIFQDIADIRDGTFNFIGLVFFIIALLINTIIFLKKKKITAILIMMMTLGGLFYTLGNVLDKWALWDADLADGFAGSFSLFAATIAFIYAFLPSIEKKLENSNKRMKKVLDAASNASINVANMATELAASASEVNAASEEISSSTQEMTNITQQIMTASGNIKNIMNVVTSISEQTNLLALNASIEAGRAGEYGRGFAVVADEVRKLAEESRTSVNMSSGRIEEIINKINLAVSNMEGISASSEEQTASMEEISATAHKLGSLAEDLKMSLQIKK